MRVVVRFKAEVFCDMAVNSDAAKFLRPILVGPPRNGPSVLIEGSLVDLEDLSGLIRQSRPWQGERVEVSFNGFSIFIPTPAIREVVIQP